MAFDFQQYLIPLGTKPYKTEFDALIAQIQAALNSNLSAIEILQGQVGAGANDNIGDIRITSGTLPAAQYLGPIPYPAGLANLSKDTYAKLYATDGFSGTDSALWMPETSGVTGDINAIAYTGVNYIAYGAAGIGLYSLDGSTWSEVGDIGGTAPASAVNAAAYNSNEHAVVFVVGNGSYIGASSDYGKTITAKLLSFVESYDIRDIKEFNGVFYIVGTRAVGSTYYSAVASFTYNSGTGVITWLTAAEGIPGQYSAIQFDGTTYAIIAGNNGATAVTARSSNFTIWTTVGTHTGFVNYNDIIFNGGVWFVAGSKDGVNGAARYSVDSGETWVTVETGAKNLNFARYDSYNLQFVFGGASDNGATFIYTWKSGDPTATPQNTGASVSLNDYAENGFGQSVIVGNSGAAYSFAAYGGDFSVLETAAVTGGLYTPLFIYKLNSGSLATTALNGSDILVYVSPDDGATWTLENTVTTGITSPDRSVIFEDTVNNKFIVAASKTDTDFELFTCATIDGTFVVKLDITGAAGTTPIASFQNMACVAGKLLIVDQRNSNYVAGAGGIYVSTDGAENFTTYTDATIPGAASPSIDGTRRTVRYLGGYFVVACSGNVPFMYSATGLSGSWTAITSLPGLTTSATSANDVGYLGGYFYAVSSSAPTSIWKTQTIGTWGAAESTNITLLNAYIYSQNGVIVTDGNIGSGGNQLAYSSDGITWAYLGYASGETLHNNDAEYAGGFPLLSGDTFRLLNYAPNVVSNTFDIPWPYPSQTLAAPYNAYIKWSD